MPFFFVTCRVFSGLRPYWLVSFVELSRGLGESSNVNVLFDEGVTGNPVS